VEVTPIIGYRGYVDLAYRSRLVASLHADVVYRGDDFEYHYGTGMKLIHRPKGEREGRERTHAYAHASLVDGQAFEALPYVEVMAIRNKTQAYQQALKDYERSRDQSKTQRERDSALRSYESSPWIAYEHEMASKTMVRRLSKMLPLSIEFANAVAVDTLSDAGALDLTAFTEPGAQAFADMSLAEDPKLIEQGREEPINITNGAQANKSGKPEKESAKQPAGEPPKQQAAAGGNPFDGTQ
jgi:recombination protein RecT